MDVGLRAGIVLVLLEVLIKDPCTWGWPAIDRSSHGVVPNKPRTLCSRYTLREGPDVQQPHLWLFKICDPLRGHHGITNCLGKASVSLHAASSS